MISRFCDIARVHTAGTGLGLYVGKNFIEALSGTISIHSEGVNKGSVFAIELPTTTPMMHAEKNERRIFED